MERPKFQSQFTKLNLLDISGLIVLGGIWVFTLSSFSALPDVIPLHFDALGRPDNYGDKQSILTLPVITTVLFFGLTVLKEYPHKFNYPTIITPGNAERQYKAARNLISTLKFILVLIFGAITFQTIQVSFGLEKGLGKWFLPVTLFFIFVPLLIFLIRASRTEKLPSER